jgi:hypothetical protein
MKQVLAVALLMMSFASVALADGPGLPPSGTTKPPKPFVQMADGPGLPPAKPPKPPNAQLA